MDYGGQLGRRFRAIKAWFVWRSFGREGMAARIREHLRLARLFAQCLEKDGRFEIRAPVTMGIVCFAPGRLLGGSLRRAGGPVKCERGNLLDAHETARSGCHPSRTRQRANHRNACAESLAINPRRD